MPESNQSTSELPVFHFVHPNKWLNDPNGLIYHNGIFHLFYQYNPNGMLWGDIHWGHATSEDGYHWDIQSTAIHADLDGLGHVFSGGGVIDTLNTSGLGDSKTAPWVFSFTHHDKNEMQRQSLAFSLDNGLTFFEYQNNPIIDNPDIKDFRDPKITWDTERKQWLMVLTAGKTIRIYVSQNLLQWTFASEFGEEYGAKGGIWECPDLFKLTCSNTQKTQWIFVS